MWLELGGAFALAVLSVAILLFGQRGGLSYLVEKRNLDARSDQMSPEEFHQAAKALKASYTKQCLFCFLLVFGCAFGVMRYFDVATRVNAILSQ